MAVTFEHLAFDMSREGLENKNGWTPLHCAADYGFRDIVELLLANHADVNATSERTVVNADPSLALYQLMVAGHPITWLMLRDIKTWRN